MVDKLLSDHLSCHLVSTLGTARATRNVSSRDIRRINLNAFKADVGALHLDRTTSFTATTLVCERSLTNTPLLDIVASLTVPPHPGLQCRSRRRSNNEDVLNGAGESQDLLCTDKSSSTTERGEETLPASKEELRVQQDREQFFLVKKLFLQAKKNYVCNKIESSSSCKDLFHITDQMSGKKKDSTLPSSIPTVDLPNTFGDFFSTKIQRLRDELDATSRQPDFSVFCGATLETFSLVTEQQVKNIILKASKKSCMLDPVPTYLVHACLDDLIPTITAIINESLMSGIVPPPFRQAIVLPLLKKPNLDRNVLKNYRPVSNLHFLSKILENVVLQQLSDHLNATDTLEPFQSAYRADHSTETLLLRVTNDLLMACDRGSVSIMSLLDLSSAFDTLDHNILLKRLRLSFGISGVVLRWLESYLTERNQTVLAGGRASQHTC